MIGEVEPLKELQDQSTRNSIIDRIINEYPVKSLDPENLFYRVRKAPGGRVPLAVRVGIGVGPRSLAADGVRAVGDDWA